MTFVPREHTTCKIGSVAELRTGWNPRGKVPKVDNGDCAILSPNGISDGAFSSWTQSDLTLLNVKSQHFLQPLDILFTNKGSSFGVIIYERYPENAVANSSFHVVRIIDSRFLPEFVVWWMAQEEVHQYLERNSGGSAIRSISLKTLSNVPVPVIPLSIQKVIADYAKMRREEANLVKTRESMKDTLTVLKMKQLIKNYEAK